MGPPEESVNPTSILPPQLHLQKLYSNLDYNETERTILNQDLIYDCGFIKIKVTEVVYAKWKRMKETLCMTQDEELLVLLLDTYQK